MWSFSLDAHGLSFGPQRELSKMEVPVYLGTEDEFIGHLHIGDFMGYPNVGHAVEINGKSYWVQHIYWRTDVTVSGERVTRPIFIVYREMDIWRFSQRGLSDTSV